MFRLVLSILFLWASFSLVMAQKTIDLSGRVLDKNSSQPLPFAGIGLKQHTISTVSNISGEFNFHIPSSYGQDTLVISMLGYHNYYIPLAAIGASDSAIRIFPMLPRERMLPELMVTDSLKAMEIMASAVEAIPLNYPQNPFLLEGFYREVSMENGKYTALLEAAVHIRTSKDKKRQYGRVAGDIHEKVGIKAIRRSFNYQKYYDKKDKGVNFLSLLLLENMVEYPDNKGCFGAFEALLALPVELCYIREQDQYYDDRPVYVIRAEPRKVPEDREPHHYRLYIDKQDRAFLKIDLFGKSKDNILHEDPFYQRAALQLLYVNNTLNYKRYKGQYYLSYIKANWGFQSVDKKTQRIMDVFEYKKELMVNHVIEHKPFYPSVRKGSMNPYKKLSLHVGSYDEGFWESYNVIKAHPLDKKIVRDLEKEYPLDSQFVTK